MQIQGPVCMSFPPLRGHEPRAALRLTHFTVRMAPVSGAEKAALDAFFKGKRGERVLIEHPPARGLGYGPTRWTRVQSVTVCILFVLFCLSARARPAHRHVWVAAR